MLKTMRKQKGFSLIEVVVAAAMVGIMATMLIPNLSGANERAKNAKLGNDLATIDQAIQLYHLDNGKVPEALANLGSDYLGGNIEFKDAKGGDLSYTKSDDNAYVLSGKNVKGETVKSPGSSGTEMSGTGGNSETSGS